MRWISAILVSILLAAPVQAADQPIEVAQITNQREAQAQRIGGRWIGHYYYAGQQANRAPVEFEMEVDVVAPGQFRARICEPNTFGTRGVPFLYANVSGEITDQGLRFTKTYDGTGGQNHSVLYVGTFNRGWTMMVGTWRIDDRTTGRFDLRR